MGRVILWVYLIVAPLVMGVVFAFGSCLFQDVDNFPDMFFYWSLCFALVIAVNTFFREDKGRGIVLALVYVAVFWLLFHYRDTVTAVFQACHFYEFYVWAYKLVHPE